MANKNFGSYGDLETLCTGYANRIKKSPRIFHGSTAEWNTLTDAQKEEWDDVALDDDYVSDGASARFDAELSATHNVYGAKNMFKPPASKSSATVNGVVFTISEDKSYVTVTATGEARSRAEFAFYARNTGEDSLVLADGNYIGSGCPSGGSSSTYMLFFDTNKTDGNLDRMVTDVGEGGTFNIHYNESTVNPSNRMQVMIRIEPTAEIPNEGFVFRPMIRDARITDAIYEPYVMTNKELMERTINYSTTKYNTGKKWIDGKTIWGKVIDIGALPNATTKSVSMGITNLGRVLDIRGYFCNSENTGGALPYNDTVDADGDSQVNIYHNDTNLVIRTTKNMASFTEAYVVLEFTETA